MNERDTILPIQIRGGAAAESASSDGGLVEINFRTRGRIGRPADIRKSQPLEELVRDLRPYVHDLPLVFVVIGTRLHESGSTGACAIDVFRSVMRQDDALWLVETCGDADTTNRSAFVTLRRSVARDAAILRNVVADLLFVAGETEEELAVLRDFAGRAPYATANASAPLLQKIVDTAAESGLGVIALDVAARTINNLDDPEPVDLEALEDVDAIGVHLRVEAARMSTRRTRRATFWRRIIGAFRRHAAKPNWELEIIDLAHRAKWPPWAVQMLPKRYVPIPGEKTDSQQAYAWRVLVECVGHSAVEIIGTLCDGEIVHIRPSREADEFFRTLDEKIGAAIGDAITNNVLADRAFGGRVAQIIDEHVDLYPRWSESIKAVARRLNL